MKTTIRSHHKSLAELNITPLLDLVFVLLVIFIITTPQLMNSLEMALPSNQQEAIKTPKPKPERIAVLGQGRVLLNERALSVDELKTELARRKSSIPALSLTVQGADNAEYESVVDVLDIIQELGITQVGLTTTAFGPNDGRQTP